MAKPDGRVERGQSLKRAISATRWNDLCDAADIVHGRRGGVTADGAFPQISSIIVPMQIETTTGDFGLGTAVTYSRSSAVGFEELAEGAFAKVGYHKARVYDATLGSSTTYPYGEAFGITKAAGQSGDVVPVIVSGFAVCRVRVISSFHSFVRPAVVRGTGPSAADLRGCLETTRCGCEGTAKLLMVGAKPAGVSRSFNWATAIL